jgi:hypothetical protein
MFRLKLIILGSFFLNIFFMLWLVRLYSSIANFSYETSVLQKSLLYNYDQLFHGIYRNKEKMAWVEKMDLDVVMKYLSKYHTVWAPDKWVFDYRNFFEKNNTDMIPVYDWYKRLDVIADAVRADDINYFVSIFYSICDIFGRFFHNYFNVYLSPDVLIWFVLAACFSLLFFSYFLDPFAYRLDLIERRLYLHERFLEEKINKGSPVDLKDHWKLKGDAFYFQKEAWRSRSYYNINQNVRGSEFRENTTYGN